MFVTGTLYSYESRITQFINLSSAIREAVNLCFNYTILGHFSYKGKTKRNFIDLELFSVIYGKFYCYI